MKRQNPFSVRSRRRRNRRMYVLSRPPFSALLVFLRLLLYLPSCLSPTITLLPRSNPTFCSHVHSLLHPPTDRKPVQSKLSSPKSNSSPTPLTALPEVVKNTSFHHIDMIYRCVSCHLVPSRIFCMFIFLRLFCSCRKQSYSNINTASTPLKSQIAYCRERAAKRE
jgi:hypothetical protein